MRTGTLSVLFNNDRLMPIYSVDVPDKRIALTFDAGWGSYYTRNILETLNRYDVKATFFVTGTWAERYPNLVSEIAESGCEIGNHSLTHPRMVGMAKKVAASEIKEAESKIAKITGKGTKLFRAPFGEYDSDLSALVRDMGYVMIQWDVDSLDWKGMDKKAVYENVISNVHNGSIILFHNNALPSCEVLGDIIEKLRSDGYKFNTVSELLIKDNYYIDNSGKQRSLE
jgi:polysaccharide deacetylase family sporulation protein PdaB